MCLCCFTYNIIFADGDDTENTHFFLLLPFDWFRPKAVKVKYEILNINIFYAEAVYVCACGCANSIIQKEQRQIHLLNIKIT